HDGGHVLLLAHGPADLARLPGRIRADHLCAGPLPPAGRRSPRGAAAPRTLSGHGGLDQCGVFPAHAPALAAQDARRLRFWLCRLARAPGWGGSYEPDPLCSDGGLPAGICGVARPGHSPRENEGHGPVAIVLDWHLRHRCGPAPDLRRQPACTLAPPRVETERL